jgi:Uma2 family endonuclease
LLVTINPLPQAPWKNGYPTSDGQPMAETDWHRDLMLLLIEVLRAFYANQQVYVTGNILVYYEPGNKRRHISPDVWLARGVDNYQRPNYLIWQEPRGPEFIIELTSKTTRNEDQRSKFNRYRDVLKVREYFLFDPLGDYLDPRLQGYRLRGNRYQRIHPRNGRLPSQVTGLHLEAHGDMLRIWNPTTQTWLPLPAERLTEAETRATDAAARATDAELRAADAEVQATQAQVRATNAEVRATQAEAEVERLRQELERLRGEQQTRE